MIKLEENRNKLQEEGNPRCENVRRLIRSIRGNPDSNTSRAYMQITEHLKRCSKCSEEYPGVLEELGPMAKLPGQE